MATRLKYDLILSDMMRASDPEAGLQLLEQTQLSNITAPVVFYVGQLDRNRQAPVGAFGITDRPDELFHYVFDVLERRQVESS